MGIHRPELRRRDYFLSDSLFGGIGLLGAIILGALGPRMIAPGSNPAAWMLTGLLVGTFMIVTDHVLNQFR